VANTLGISINSLQVATITAGGWLIGPATGSWQGAGTLNAVGLYVNGVAVGGGGGVTVYSAAQTATLMTVGQQYIIYRGASNVITNNTTLTQDAVLQFTNVPIGRYICEVYTIWQAASTVAGGFQAAINYSGTFTARGYMSLSALGNTMSQLSGGTEPLNSAGIATSAFAANTDSTSYQIASISVTGIGTFSAFYCNISNGTTTIEPGSYIKLTRLA
jgi:hypothetical protein